MSGKPTIRAVTFDAAGTLIRVAEPVGETYARIAARTGATLPPTALAAAFHEEFPRMPPMAFPGLDGPALREAERGWWRDLVARVVARTGSVAAFDDYFDALFAHYANGAAWLAYPEVHGVLESMRRQGLGIAVVSNFDSRLPSILTELGISPLVDTIVYSTGSGAAKPYAGIFRAALKALNVPPENALHVGDSLDADVRGAAAAGLTGVFLNRRDSGSPEDVLTVRHLGELERLLDERDENL